jgi:hypothetical protein
MFHPKHLVMTTPQVFAGAPVLVIFYSPEQSWAGSTAGEGGTYGGWILVHSADPNCELDIRFAEDIAGIDPYVEEVVERGIPGTYTRETGDAPFDRDWDDDDDEADS